MFNGPQPTIEVLDTQQSEMERVGQWLEERTHEGLKPHEIGVFVRSPAELDRARRASEVAGLPFRVMDEHVEQQF